MLDRALLLAMLDDATAKAAAELKPDDCTAEETTELNDGDDVTNAELVELAATELDTILLESGAAELIEPEIVEDSKALVAALVMLATLLLMELEPSIEDTAAELTSEEVAVAEATVELFKVEEAITDEETAAAAAAEVVELAADEEASAEETGEVSTAELVALAAELVTKEETDEL